MASKRGVWIRATDRKARAGAIDLFADCERIVAAAMDELAMRFRGELSEDERRAFAHEAYAAMLERHAQGVSLRSPLAYARRAAVRKVIDSRLYGAGRFEGAVGPLGDMRGDRGRELDPEESTFARIDIARGVAAAQTLSSDDRAIYRAVHQEGLKVREASARLGFSFSKTEKGLRRAREHVASAMRPNADSPAQVAAFELLERYAQGSASAHQRRAAELLLKADPVMRTYYRDLVSAHHAVAGALAPLALEGAGHDGGMLERLAATLGRARDAVASLTGRGADEASDIAGRLAASGAGKSAGAAGAGLLAKLGMSGGGIAACVAGGVTVAACIATGVLPNPLPGGDGSAARQMGPAHAKPQTPNALRTVVPDQVGHTEPASAPKVKARQREDRDGGEAPAPVGSAPAPEPVVAPTAPATTQEFGVEAAAVPASGPTPGDANDADGASAQTVRQEFGP